MFIPHLHIHCVCVMAQCNIRIITFKNAPEKKKESSKTAISLSIIFLFATIITIGYFPFLLQLRQHWMLLIKNGARCAHVKCLFVKTKNKTIFRRLSVNSLLSINFACYVAIIDIIADALQSGASIQRKKIE